MHINFPSALSFPRKQSVLWVLFLDWYSEPTPCQWLLPARMLNVFTSLWKKKKRWCTWQQQILFTVGKVSRFHLHLHRKHLPSANWERSSQFRRCSIVQLCTMPFVIRNSHPKIKWVSWTLEYFLKFFFKFFLFHWLYREPPGKEL